MFTRNAPDARAGIFSVTGLNSGYGSGAVGFSEIGFFKRYRAARDGSPHALL
jgi:hypothetical protein